jgi:hypothetical protein
VRVYRLLIPLLLVPSAACCREAPAATEEDHFIVRLVGALHVDLPQRVAIEPFHLLEVGDSSFYRVLDPSHLLLPKYNNCVVKIWGEVTKREQGLITISATRIRFIRQCRTIVLYSWKPGNHAWHFVTKMEDRDPRTGGDRQLYLRSDRDVTHAPHQIVGVVALKAFIASMPSLTNVPWSDRPFSEIVTYPDYHIRDDIIKFGREHHVFIHVVP